jgi:CRISPR-associated endonuclease/helicase Cas3
LILDEVQTLPARLIPAVQILLQKMCEKLNLKILYMTATHPPFLKNAQSVLQDEEKYFEPINRTQLNLNIKETIPFTKYLENLPAWLLQRKGKSILLVANTIRSSLKLFDCLNTLRKQDESFQDMQLFYISGNIVPVERIKMINEIKQLLNTQPRPWLVVVSTQCIEAGVNIDMDEVVRDFGPWDSIMQICGRANRFDSRERAPVWIYRWSDDLSDRGREFHSYIYDPILTDATSSALSKYESIVEEVEYLDIQKLYSYELEQRLSQYVSQELIKYALSWQFDELDFREPFRGDNKAWKVSLFCIADDTANKLKDIAIELWSSREPMEALKLLDKLCENSDLFSSIEQFLRIKPQSVKQFINGLKGQTERKLLYQLPKLLNPMLQAYTISISVRSLEGLNLGHISEGFSYIPRESYEVLCGFSDVKRSEILSNII